MKTIAFKRLTHKYGRKAMIFYLVWCTLKGLFFLFAGARLAISAAEAGEGTVSTALAAGGVAESATSVTDAVALANGVFWTTVLLACATVVYAVVWMKKIEHRDYYVGKGNAFMEEMDGEMFR